MDPLPDVNVQSRMMIRPAMARVPRHAVAMLAASLLVAGLVVSRASSAQPPPSGSGQAPRPDAEWQPLFDGKTLGNWRPTKFTADGAVKVEDGRIVLDTGRSMTGITWGGAVLPATNYEIALQAMRIEGSDFFAGVTFPVDNSFCSLILGGWGGSVVGLSSINGQDASENDTSQSMDFENGRWYSVRIRVTPAKIEAWLDDRQIISQDLKGRRIDIRIEMEFSKPLGVASWRTKAAVRDVRLRRL
jgi:hypothetical protein